MMLKSALPLILGHWTCVSADPAPRNVRIDGQRFYETATNNTIVMAGPNVVVKGKIIGLVRMSQSNDSFSFIPALLSQDHPIFLL